MVGDRRKGMNDFINRLIKEDKIETSLFEWSSPAFVVPMKEPGDWRLVIDYRYLNSMTRVDAHPLQRIHDILQRQGKFKMWSLLDMKDGFHQIPLKKWSIGT